MRPHIVTTICKMLIYLVILSTFVTLNSAQHFYQQPSKLILPAAGSYAHPAVIANAEREAHYPPELVKSDRFYKNPAIASALAKESWLTDKEMPVFDREAEKIPHEEIEKIFKNAGFIRRR